MFTRDAMIKGIAKATAKDKAKKNQPKETMQTEYKKTSMQYQKNMQSNAKTDDLYRKIQDNENQWFAFDYILDHLSEEEKVKIRKYIRDLIKEEKKTPKINW